MKMYLKIRDRVLIVSSNLSNLPDSQKGHLLEPSLPALSKDITAGLQKGAKCKAEGNSLGLKHKVQQS